MTTKDIFTSDSNIFYVLSLNNFSSKIPQSFFDFIYDIKLKLNAEKIYPFLKNVSYKNDNQKDFIQNAIQTYITSRQYLYIFDKIDEKQSQKNLNLLLQKLKLYENSTNEKNQILKFIFNNISQDSKNYLHSNFGYKVIDKGNGIYELTQGKEEEKEQEKLKKEEERKKREQEKLQGENKFKKEEEEMKKIEEEIKKIKEKANEPEELTPGEQEEERQRIEEEDKEKIYVSKERLFNFISIYNANLNTLEDNFIRCSASELYINKIGKYKEYSEFLKLKMVELTQRYYSRHFFSKGEKILRLKK